MSALGTTYAHADDPYQPVNLPVCEVFTLPGGLKICGYRDVADWRLVLEVDAEVTELRAKVVSQAEQLAAAEDRSKALGMALAVSKAGADDSRRALEGERTALVALNKELQEERARPRWGSKLSWAIAAIAVGVAIGAIASD